MSNITDEITQAALSIRARYEGKDNMTDIGSAMLIAVTPEDDEGKLIFDLHRDLRTKLSAALRRGYRRVAAVTDIESHLEAYFPCLDDLASETFCAGLISVDAGLDYAEATAQSQAISWQFQNDDDYKSLMRHHCAMTAMAVIDTIPMGSGGGIPSLWKALYQAGESSMLTLYLLGREVATRRRLLSDFNDVVRGYEGGSDD